VGREWRKRTHSDGEDNSRDHLYTPGNTERGVTLDVRATELNKVLEEDTPSNAPLLEAIMTVIGVSE
jgi:hypothetical protein